MRGLVLQNFRPYIGVQILELVLLRIWALTEMNYATSRYSNAKSRYNGNQKCYGNAKSQKAEIR